MKIVWLLVAVSASALLACGQDKPASGQSPAAAPTPAPPPAADSYMPGANVGAAPPDAPNKDDAKK